MSIIERAAGKLGQPDNPATTIHANRSPASREESGRLIEAAIERGDGEGSLIGFITDIATGWTGVNDGAGKPVEFTADALAKVCRVPGMATLIFKAYTAEVGAKEKN